MQVNNRKLQACAELALVLFAHLFLVPHCTTRRFKTWHDDTIPTDVVLDELRRSDRQWSIASLIPFLMLWTAWQYTRCFDGSLILELVRRSEDGAQRAPEGNQTVVGDAHAPAGHGASEKADHPARHDATKEEAGAARGPDRTLVDHEAERKLVQEAIAGVSKNLVAQRKLAREELAEVSRRLHAQRKHALDVLCRPRAVHTILCLTDHAPSSHDPPAPTGDVNAWEFPDEELHHRFVGVLAFANAEVWDGLVPDAQSGPATGLGSLALLLGPVADNVLRGRSSFLAADGPSGSGKTQTLMHAAAYVGACMLKDPSTAFLQIYAHCFFPAGDRGEPPVMPADHMSAAGVKHVESTRQWSLAAWGTKKTLSHYDVSDVEGLVAVLRYIKKFQESCQGHFHLAVARRARTARPETLLDVDGALLMVDIRGGLSGSQDDGDDPSREAVCAFLEGRPGLDRGDDEGMHDITDIVRMHKCTSRILLSHVNVNHSSDSNRGTLEFARSIASVV